MSKQMTTVELNKYNAVIVEPFNTVKIKLLL